MKTRVALIGGSAMIPSLMIRTSDRNRPWITGADAAGINPDGNMEVFENWKSALYSSEFDAHKVRLVMVAGHFFGWLSDRLNSCGVDFGANCRVRVTIPGLKRIEDRKDALIECMRLNGWPNHIEVVIEPVANFVGVLSGGRNYVSAYGRMSYGPTIGDADGTAQHEFKHVFDEMRRFVRGNGRARYMTISVVDLGSFTLDVAKMTLDLKVTEREKFSVDEILEESWEVGIIDDLDKPCLSKIFSSYGIDEGSSSFVVRELAKSELYAGREFAIPGTRVVLGNSESDKEIVSSTIQEYCQKAWSKVAGHCKDSEVTVLTGGGACIPQVRAFLLDQLRRSNVRKIVGLSAASVLAQRTADSRIIDWEVSGQGLERLATCLGAASIGFGFRPDEACRKFVRT